MLIAFLLASAYTAPLASRPAARTAQPRAMHSDSRPTREYMDYLLGENQPEETVDMPSIIVGDGRVGTLLAEFGKRRGFEDTLVKRGDPIPELQAGGQLVRMPIYICTRNEDLDAVIATCPQERWEDLVFLQNGQLEPLRQRYGLYDTTQAGGAAPARALSSVPSQPPSHHTIAHTLAQCCGSRRCAKAASRWTA